MIVSFNERRGFYCEFQSILSANLCHCITADQTLSLHFLVGWLAFCGFILMKTVGPTKHQLPSYHLFSASKNPNIPT
jgi:hypothetical protein